MKFYKLSFAVPYTDDRRIYAIEGNAPSSAVVRGPYGNPASFMNLEYLVDENVSTLLKFFNQLRKVLPNVQDGLINIASSKLPGEYVNLKANEGEIISVIDKLQQRLKNFEEAE